MTLPANIRVNVSAAFPARVTGANFIVVSKANGIWTIEADYTGIQPIPDGVTSGLTIVAVYDPGTQSFYSTTVAAISEAAQQRPVTLLTTGSAYAVQPADGDLLVALITPGAFEVDLGAAGLALAPISVKDLIGNASTNNITIVPAGSETIDGQANLVLNIDYADVDLYPISGTGWYIK